MTMNLRMLSIAAAAFCVQAQVPLFQSTTDAVSIDVAVFDGDRVVRNLGVSGKCHGRVTSAGRARVGVLCALMEHDALFAL